MKRTVQLLALAIALTGARGTADAFCGFYVSGAGADMFNNATQVVMMRVGTRTVLSMQNNYQGPPSDFALVVPVPVVLQKENVVTLPADIFSRVDRLAAPRLVEYWEKDPCDKPRPRRWRKDVMMAPMSAEGGADDPADLGVTVEAQFEVGEYQVVILSAKESTGLDTYLRQEGYKIPDGAEPYLRPYVEGGLKFFVAKVDAQKVTFENGMAMLSPLRFHYDSQDFNLPIRLGMMNSAGTQDLIVHILAPNQRYEVANYPNTFIPTNIDVANEVRHRFGEFYAALFDATLARNEGAVVTEYAWDAQSCDPCPTPPLQPNDLATLGADVVGDPQQQGRGFMSFTITRLHARYAKDGVTDDLVFKAAPPVVGGRENRHDGRLEESARPASVNNFQARYAIRHEWTGPIDCLNPIRGRWGGPPDGEKSVGTEAATDLAFAPRGEVSLPQMIRTDIPEIGVTARAAGSSSRPGAVKGTGCAGCSTGGAAAGGLVLVIGVVLVVARRRR
jgi:MYXO-CTERM domain-containing protein